MVVVEVMMLVALLTVMISDNDNVDYDAVNNNIFNHHRLTSAFPAGMGESTVESNTHI